MSFHFDISLTVLNSLGRDLYRSVNTILGEAISNSWDADAHNVYIYIDKENNNLIIKDDGIGMDETDFQEKFLKIGYSKRKNGVFHSLSGRPYIGRKGIGKLALLSCSQKIHVLTKTKNSNYIGAIIDNKKIDKDIDKDLSTQEHSLEEVNIKEFHNIVNDNRQGTIIKFEKLNSGIKNQVDFFKKVIALYYRFSLIDDDFNIYLNDEKITAKELADLVNDTQIFWMINDLEKDSFVKELKNKKNGIKEGRNFKNEKNISGFIASVKKPSNMKMRGALGERLTLDLFVNGRVREKDILRHISKNRVYESYLYGQIHFDELDDEKDRFTSSREGIKADDEKFNSLLQTLKKDILPKVADEWDKIRLSLKEDGDPENPRKTPKQRKAESLYNEVAKDYTQSDSKEIKSEKNNGSDRNVSKWVEELREDASFNTQSYTECFLSENLIRKYINKKSVELTKEARDSSNRYKEKEQKNKIKAGINIELRQKDSDESYLDMDHLANLVDKPDASSPATQTTLSNRAKEYKPIRDAVMHTALITIEAKRKLTTVYDDIKARLIKLFYDK